MMRVAKVIECRISLDAREDDGGAGLGRRPLRVLLEPAEDVLDVDDGVVDELADRHRQAARASSC